MKEPKLIDFLLQMQEIDDSFIDEALKKEEKNIKHTHRSKLSALVAAILSIVILVSITIVANDLMPLIIPEKATPYNPDNYALPEGALDENGQFTSEYLDYIERQQTGGFARSDWEHLTAEDYRTLDKNEEGVTYLEVANARQFVLDGTVIITDENGEPFKFIFNENDYVSTTIQKNLKLAQNDYFPTLGYIVDGEVFKKTSGFTDPDKVGSFGLVHEFDKDTEAYIFLHSDEPVYVDYVNVRSSQLTSYGGGESYRKYYIDDVLYEIERTTPNPVCEIPLEEVRNIKFGSGIYLNTSEELLANMKAGAKVYVRIDIDLDKSSDTRWMLQLLKDYPEYESVFGSTWHTVQHTYKRNSDVYVMFEIPEDGDYYISFINGSIEYMEILSCTVEIEQDF